MTQKDPYADSPRRLIFPHVTALPPRTTDLGTVPDKIHVLRLDTGAKSYERLPMLKDLRKLWWITVNDQKLAILRDCPGLKSLHLESVKAKDLSSLTYLPHLTVLSIETSSTVTSLTELASLASLEGLGLVDLKRVSDLSPLSSLKNLRALCVSGSIWARMQVESLAPLGPLTSLRYLDLTNLKVKDESLRPLGSLDSLEELDIANYYPMEEFAWLAGRLPRTKCTWFSPDLDFEHELCKKCKAKALVIPTGSRKRMLCKTCDAPSLESHRARFEKLRREAAASAS